MFEWVSSTAMKASRVQVSHQNEYKSVLLHRRYWFKCVSSTTVMANRVHVSHKKEYMILSLSVSSSAGTRPKGCEVHPHRRVEYRLCRKRSTVLCFSFDLSGKIFRFL